VGDEVKRVGGERKGCGGGVGVERKPRGGAGGMRSRGEDGMRGQGAGEDEARERRWKSSGRRGT